MDIFIICAFLVMWQCGVLLAFRSLIRHGMRLHYAVGLTILGIFIAGLLWMALGITNA